MIVAAQAGNALNVVATKLLEYGIVQQEGYAELTRIGQQLKGLKQNTSWQMSVNHGTPITFEKVKDKNGKQVSLQIVSAGIDVLQTDTHKVPFSKLDVAIEINDEIGDPVSRWHLDLANEANGKYQTGPLVHLQYGGHYHDKREFDHPLKAPRWCHPPMEIALLCEVVTANFFEDRWLGFREEPNWCSAIHLFQQLCFTNYLEKLQSCANMSSTTALKEMWAADWR